MATAPLSSFQRRQTGAPDIKAGSGPLLEMSGDKEEAKSTALLLVEDSNNYTAAGSSPSSPEFLLPAFETSVHISSSSPILEHRGDQAVAAASVTHQGPVSNGICNVGTSNTTLSANDRSPSRRFRSLSKSNTIKKFSRNASPPVAQSLLDSHDLRKFRKAEQRLSESVYYLARKYYARTAQSIDTTSAVPGIATEGTGIPIDAERQITPPPPSSPPTTPSQVASSSRRARIVRALTMSPPGSPMGASPTSAQQQTTPRSRSGRRWSNALHAILSPSPSLTRGQLPTLASASDVAWAESTASSPIVDSSEVRRWEIVAAVESTRRAQSDMLKLLRELVAKADKKLLSDVPEMKESVLFLAQFLQCGGQVPDMQSLDGLFATVKSAGSRLCKSLSRLRSRETVRMAFNDRYKPAAILCHCLKNAREQEIDVFGVKVAITKNEHELAVRSRAFVQHYQDFVESLREYHIQYRLERRAKRRERRLARMDKAHTLCLLGPEGNEPISPAAAEIATMSTQELLQHSLRHAIQDGLFDNDDVEAFDPRLMLTLPRLALFYGVRHSAFPASQPPREDDNPYFAIPMEVFLPRICRKLPAEAVSSIRCLEDHKALQLVRKLSGVDDEGDAQSALPDSHIDELFLTIAREADAGSTPARDPRANKLLSRALALHMSDGAEDFSLDDDATISKAYIMLMGIAST